LNPSGKLALLFFLDLADPLLSATVGQ